MVGGLTVTLSRKPYRTRLAWGGALHKRLPPYSAVFYFILLESGKLSWCGIGFSSAFYISLYFRERHFIPQFLYRVSLCSHAISY